jgi:hypothetical protein
MTIHKAKLVEGSVEDLGPNGMAFSVICCDDEKTVQRHTLHHAHTMTDAELRARLDYHVKEHARSHLASEKNVARVAAMLGEGEICHVCDEKSLTAPKRPRRQKAT